MMTLTFGSRIRHAARGRLMEQGSRGEYKKARPDPRPHAAARRAP
jgi:hypothetical protein